MKIFIKISAIIAITLLSACNNGDKPLMPAYSAGSTTPSSGDSPSDSSQLTPAPAASTPSPPAPAPKPDDTQIRKDGTYYYYIDTPNSYVYEIKMKNGDTCYVTDNKNYINVASGISCTKP